MVLCIARRIRLRTRTLSVTRLLDITRNYVMCFLVFCDGCTGRMQLGKVAEWIMCVSAVCE